MEVELWFLNLYKKLAKGSPIIFIYLFIYFCGMNFMHHFQITKLFLIGI